MVKYIIAILLIFCSAGWSASLKPSEKDLDIFRNVIDYVFQDSFASALEIASGLNDTLPGRPIFHLLKGSIIHAQMLDAEDDSEEKEFLDDINKATTFFNRWSNKNPKDQWGYFFGGTAYGYKAVWLAQKKSWLKAMFAGLKAKSRFSDALKIDPRFYDCYAGAGSYHYWSSSRLRKFLPFLPDNQNDGLRELRLAADSAGISAKPAMAGLAWALINEKNFRDAIAVANRLKEATNSGRNSLWILGGVYWRNGNLRKAAQAYGELIKSLELAGNQNGYNLIFLHYRMGICYNGMGNKPAAEDEFKKVLSYDASDRIRQRHADTYRQAKKYLEKMEKDKEIIVRKR